MNVPRLILLLILTFMFPSLGAKTPILGTHSIDAEQMYQFVASRNPDLCQAIIETGWFRFDNGTAVTPDAHNYCGMGVRRRGDKGCVFGSVREGVTAMIQHLYAYACRHDLPEGEQLLDPRFGYVDRGSAKSWESLSGRWAMNPRYGKDILDMYRRMERHDNRSSTKR